MKQTSDKINNNEEERIKKIYGKIHKNFLENKNIIKRTKRLGYPSLFI